MPRPKSYDRAVSLERAMHAFWSTGFPATSMRALCATTGIGPKSLYAEFGTKKDVFLEAIDTYIQAATRAHYHALRAGPHGLHCIEQHLLAQQGAGDISGCLLVNTLAERESVPPAALEKVDRFFAMVRQLYADNLLAARDNGDIRPDVNLADLAAALVTFDQGIAIAVKSPLQQTQTQKAVQALLSAIRI